MADPLHTVLRLRRAALDEVRQRLAERVEQAARAHDAIRANTATIEREMAAASDSGFDDGAVEAFAAWLPGARQRLAQAHAEHERLEAEVGRLRAELAGCRAAAEAVEALIADRRRAAHEAATRRALAALAEHGARPDPL